MHPLQNYSFFNLANYSFLFSISDIILNFIISHLCHSLGDILGSALQNIQDLLMMPYGCGEQNMVLFAPNIYVLDYLNETQQLTQKVKDKAIGYLNMGEY